jgi:phospholipase/carboxylesterase
VPTRIEAVTSFERGWIFKTRPAASTPPAGVIVLIHGWTGDENSMDIFARELPGDHLLFSPRGLITLAGGGYGWVERSNGNDETIADFLSPAEQLMREIELKMEDLSLPQQPLSLVGFSQGAALCYGLALCYPERIQRLAALAGYLPEMTADFKMPALNTMKVFISHGKRDETIPIEKAHRAVQAMEKAGASVTYCESNSGHKLALPCFQDLKNFLLA